MVVSAVLLGVNLCRSTYVVEEKFASCNVGFYTRGFPFAWHTHNSAVYPRQQSAMSGKEYEQFAVAQINNNPGVYDLSKDGDLQVHFTGTSAGKLIWLGIVLDICIIMLMEV